MYDDLIYLIQKINRNHFGFSNIQITEKVKLSIPKVSSNWQSIVMNTERKLSMTLLLNDP